MLCIIGVVKYRLQINGNTAKNDFKILLGKALGMGSLILKGVRRKHKNGY
jgi:selenophosphate synthase